MHFMLKLTYHLSYKCSQFINELIAQHYKLMKHTLQGANFLQEQI